jgi:two-component system chemotaxis response regulator CheY
MSAKKSLFSAFVRGLFSSTVDVQLETAMPILADKGKKVLVVDDDPIFQKIISQKLKESGYKVINAIDGSEALAAMREEKPDAVLLDINFPPDISNGVGVPWDGIQLMNWIRLMEGQTRIPIFIVTNDDISLYEAKAAEGGAKGVFFKALDQNRLVNMVNSVFEQQSMSA